MFYTIAIVGRPNVGKSTLFNALINDRQALVADYSGLTRDRQYGFVDDEGLRLVYVDTPGIGLEDDTIDKICTKQTEYAIEEADLILFVVDARAGLLPVEEGMAKKLRESERTVCLVVNKIDGINEDLAISDFYRLGFGIIVETAASHRRGLNQLKETIYAHLATIPVLDSLIDEDNESNATTVAIVGRPNVGKSTLINRLLGEERVVAHDMPGTTRDSIVIDFNYRDEFYRLIDTAGIRRKSKIDVRQDKGVEKFSVSQSFKSIDKSDVTVFLIDANEGVVDQDLTLLSLVIQAGVGLVIAVNKWDGHERDHKDEVKAKLKEKLYFMDYVPVKFISALHGTGVGDLFKLISKMKRDQYRSIATSELTRLLEDAVEKHPPPMVRGRRVKIRYAHLGGHRPFTVVVHGNQVGELNQAYRRYLENYFRKALGGFEGFPISVIFKTGDNPYEGKKNDLTKRQVGKRRRLMKHIKKKK